MSWEQLCIGQQEFRSAVLGHLSDLRKSLMQEPGSTPVDMEA